MDTFLFELLTRPAWAPRWLDFLMLGATTVGLAVPLLIAGWLLWSGGPRRRLGWTLIAALGVTLVVTLLLQLVVGRARPEGVRTLMAVPAFASFPSGHASLLAATAAVLLCAAWRRLWLWAALPALALLVALSRVYVGHHYPSDVLAGLVLGVGLGVGVHGWRQVAGVGIAERLRWLLWPQLALMAVISLCAYLRLLPALPPFASDKLLHFVFFGLATANLDLWLRWRDLTWRDQTGRNLAWARLDVPVALPLAFVPVLLEECLQGLSPARTFELLDLGADLAGMVFFLVLLRWLLRPRIAASACAGRP